MHHPKSGNKVGLVGVLIFLLAPLFSAVPVAGVPGDIYSSTATLTDGVEGLDLSRTTTVEAQVWAIESVGELMLVGGAFTHVRDRSSFERIPRPYLAGFNPTTGEYVPWFRTQPDGPVYDIIDLGEGRAVLLGEFTSVNGVAGTHGVAIIDISTGLVDTTLNVRLSPPMSAAVRSGVVNGNYLYLAGSFGSAEAGGVSLATSGLARIDLATGELDPGFDPRLVGGGAWAIDVDPATGRVFGGGYFSRVNNSVGTETLVALNADGSLVSGWNHGFPHNQCTLGTFVSCGAITGLAVANGKVFVAGAKHFWAALDAGTGQILADRKLSNDGQSVDVVDGMVVVGCHCSDGDGSDEFPTIEDRYIRIIDPSSLTEVESPTVNSEGAAGGWVAGGADDGCMWVGGNFSSTTVGSQVPAWSLLRFCRNSGVGNNAILPIPTSFDSTPPPGIGAPVVVSQRGSSITLQWTASTEESGQVLYNVYRNGNLVARTSGSSFVDALLDPNAIYYWQISAEDLAGNLGPISPRSTPVQIGTRYNAAIAGTATQFNDFTADTTADKAVDGNTDGVLTNGSVARTAGRVGEGRSWWNLDLGDSVDIDLIEVHPRTDSAAFSETNNRLRIYYHTEPIVGDNMAAASNSGAQVWVGDRPGGAPVVERAELSTAVRYLRLFNDAASLSVAEVKVYTVDVLPQPASPAADLSSPLEPVWSLAQSRGANTVLSWGGSTDNVGVAFYEVYKDSVLISSSTTRSVSVGAVGQRSSAFHIVAYDAAGNHSALPPDVHPLTNAARFVTQQYRDFLNREPLIVEQVGWTTDIESGKRSRTDLATRLLTSAEYIDVAHPNIRLYEAYFNRIPDVGGLKYWMDVRRQGYSIDLVSDQFGRSTEFQNTYGNTTDAEFIRQVYLNVLDREPDAGGYTYWQDLLTRQIITRGQLMVNFSESQEYRNTLAPRVRVVGTYIALLNRIPSVIELAAEEQMVVNGEPASGLVSRILASDDYFGRFTP
jgi:hypothetical protein